MTSQYAKQRAIKQLNEKLLEAKEKAEQSNKAKSQFLATMSHELRTPLHGVIACCDILMNSSLTTEQFNYAKLMYNSSNILLKIITNILDFSKIEAGKLILEKTSFDLVDTMKNIVDCLKVYAQKKSVKLELIIEEEFPQYLIGDPTRLAQVIFNLLENGLKFTQKDGNVTFQISKVKQNDNQSNQVYIEFKVKDTGIGISKQNIAILFQHFTQVDSSTTRVFGGTGLGLAISQSIVELMNGHIEVDTEENSGSTFKFTCPFEIAPRSPEEKEKSSNGLKVKSNTDNETTITKKNDIENVPSPIFSNLNRRILIAEDNNINVSHIYISILSSYLKRNVIIKMLNNIGYHNLSIARDGDEAVEKFKNDNFDIVLMDISMPKVFIFPYYLFLHLLQLDGIQATTLIRKFEEDNGREKVPIVAVTANATDFHKKECLDAGMTDFITKPVIMKTLKNILNTML